MVHVAAGAVSAMRFNEDRLAAASANPALLATEAADYLVKKGIPFRQAHDLAGNLLREAERQAKPWTKLSLEDFRRISPAFDADVANALQLAAALQSKNVPGGTAENSVCAAISQLEQKLKPLENKP